MTAPERVRAFVNRMPAGMTSCEDGPERLKDDLRELLLGYIPPEHHESIRCALEQFKMLGKMYGTETKYCNAALAAMPKGNV
jgi:hypothetical protein